MPEEQPKKSTFKIKVDGSELPENEGVVENISLVRVTQVHDGPHSFEFKVSPKGPTTYPADTKFNVGAEVEIEMGYDQLARVFKGLITQVEMDYPLGKPNDCIVAGYDRLHVLTRGRFTEHWESVKYSAVVSAIASKCGLSGAAKDTGTTFKYVAMNNQTYFSFVMDLARRMGYEVNVDDKTLNFRPPEDTTSEVATVTFGVDMQRGKFRMQSSGQVTEVHVLGYDDTQKKQVLGKALAADVSGDKTGPKLSESKFGKAPFWVSNYSVATQAEADKVAKSVINQIANQFCTMEAEVLGNTAIKAATVVKVEGVAPPFTGNYYVARAVHEVTGGKKKGPQYVTKIVGVRNHWNL